jgi:hypothetical protein
MFSHVASLLVISPKKYLAIIGERFVKNWQKKQKIEKLKLY